MPVKIKKRGKNSYLLTVTNGYVDGKQKTFTKTIKCSNRTEANKEYKLFEAECLKGEVLSSQTLKLTIAQLYAYWLKNHGEVHLSLGTIQYYQFVSTRILAALGHLRIDKITPRHIHQFLEQLRKPDASIYDKPLSATTIRKHYIFLKDLLNCAVKWDFLVTNPMANIEPPKRAKDIKVIPTLPTLSSLLSKLLEIVNELKQNHNRQTEYSRYLRYQLWVSLAFALGRRREEIFGLQKKDFDLPKKLVSIQRAAVFVAGTGVIIKETKTISSNRTLVVPDQVIAILVEYLSFVPSKKVVIESEWLFPQPNGKPTHPDAFNAFLRKFTANHNLPKLSPHILRHMHGSYLMRAGVDLATTSHQLGHSNKSFTADTYIHVTEQVDQTAARTMDTILGDLTQTNKNKAA